VTKKNDSEFELFGVRLGFWARCGRRELHIGSKIDEPIIHFEETLGGRRVALVLPSHGENRGSSPLGSANTFNDLISARCRRNDCCLFFVYYHFSQYIFLCDRVRHVRRPAIHCPVDRHSRPSAARGAGLAFGEVQPVLNVNSFKRT
jgi:hypothetical protein